MRRAPSRLAVRAAAITLPDLDHDRAGSLHAGSPRHRRPRGRERPGVVHSLTQLPGGQRANLTPGGHSGHHAPIVGAAGCGGEVIFEVVSARFLPLHWMRRKRRPGPARPERPSGSARPCSQHRLSRVLNHPRSGRGDGRRPVNSNAALSDAMRKSQARASSQPPPNAGPSTSAIVGHRCASSCSKSPALMASSAASASRPRSSAMSAPAAKIPGVMECTTSTQAACARRRARRIARPPSSGRWRCAYRACSGRSTAGGRRRGPRRWSDSSPPVSAARRSSGLAR